VNGTPAWMELIPPECIPNVHELVTEDNTPVENIFTALQYQMLTEPLNSSWVDPNGGRPFLALSNVGLFYRWRVPPVVPDCMLGLNVQLQGSLLEKENHSWFTWLIGKSPDVVIEIVSDRRGGEFDEKLELYVRLRVPYYAIYDYKQVYGDELLHVFAEHHGKYERIEPGTLPGIGLGLKLWDGVYDQYEAKYLRWCDAEGRLIATGAELAIVAKQHAEDARQRAEEERQRAEEERQRAEEERQRADRAHQRVDEERLRADQAAAHAARLAEQLRALGVNPTP
jgi:Uma2 family endonuclease